MTQLTLLKVLELSLMLVSTNYRYLACAQANNGIPPTSIAGSGNGMCPGESTRETLKSALQQETRTRIQNYIKETRGIYRL